jgi:hypothetical protein
VALFVVILQRLRRRVVLPAGATDHPKLDNFLLVLQVGVVDVALVEAERLKSISQTLDDMLRVWL